MAERGYIDGYFRGETSAAISSLSQGLVTRELTLQKLVECLAPELTNPDSEVRARGTRLLADVVHAVPSSFLSESEVSHLCQFFCDRLKDQHVITPHVLYGMLALARFHSLVGDHAVDIIQGINKEVHVQALVRVDRSVVYNIVHALLEKHMQALLTMGVDFVFAFIQMMDGEQDPRNLLLAFNLVPTITSRFPIDRFVEDLFDVTSCYFPVSFTPQPDDPSAITQEQLCEALRACVCSTPAFASLTLPLLLEKVSSNVASAKLDSIQTLAFGAPVFGASEIAPFIEGIWLAMRTEVFRSSSEKLVDACLSCLTALTKVFSSEPSGACLKDLMDRVLKECTHHYKQPQLGLTSISSRLLRAACLGSAVGCSIVLKEVVPVIVEQFAAHSASGAQCNLMDSLRALISAAATFYMEAPAEAVLEPHTEAILSVVFSALSEGDPQLRVFACGCLEDLLASSSILSHEQGMACVKTVVNTLQGDDTADVRVRALQVATCACRHFPEICLQLLLPSVAEWLQLRRTSCDAGLKDHMTEDFVLSVSAEVAVHGKLLPVLVEMWMGQFEHIVQDAWSDDLPRRCNALISALQMASKHFSQDAAMLEVVWQSIVMHVTHCLMSAAQAESTSTQVKLFTDSSVVEAASQFVGSLVGRVDASSQTALVTQFVEVVTGSDRFKPFESESPAQHAQIVMLLAAVVPSVKPANLPDTLFGLLVPGLNMAVSCPHSEPAVAACVLCASLLNKLVDEAALTGALQAAMSVIHAALGNGLTTSAVTLLGWVTRGLLLRSHPAAMTCSSELMSLFVNKEAGPKAAAAFVLLLNDQACRNLTVEGGATVRFLHKQKFFVQIRPHLVDGFQQAATGEVKDCYLTALSHLLFHVPEQVLLAEIPPLLPLVIRCLSSSEPRLITSSLASIVALLNGAADLLSSHASDIIPLLLSLSRFKGNLKVRQASLQCLGKLTALPHHLLYPHKDRILQQLIPCLDDHKRIVRREAVECRNSWILLGAASS